MDARIQQVLDGERAREELTETEAAELAGVESGFDGILAAIPVEPLAPLGAAVLARINAEEAASRNGFAVRSAVSWLWAPRAVALKWRPAYALPVAAVLAFLLLGRQGDDRAPVAAATPAQVLVEFRLDAPEASQVALAGDFTNWQPSYALVRGEPGVWTIVVPMKPGVHDYAFIVDGVRWVPDPMAPAIEDGFGGLNSRISVLAPDGAART